MKHTRIEATYPMLQADVDRAIEAVQAVVTHATTIRDHGTVFRPAEEQAKRLEARLLHAAEIVGQLARLQ
jgi:pseudouridine-5'-phosphate glycosidase